MTNPTDSKFDQFKWQRRMVRDRNLTPTTRLVGAALWGHAKPDGGSIHPGRNLLSKDLGISKSTVDRALTTLRDAGWIVREYRGGTSGRRDFADVYRLTLPKSVVMSDETPEDQSAPVTTDQTTSQHQCVDQSSPVRQPVSTSDDPTTHEQLKEQHLAPATPIPVPVPALTVIDGGNTRMDKTGFDEFSATYPKPIPSSQRNEARQLWQTAASKHGRLRVHRAAQRYAATFEDHETKFSKSALAWFKDDVILDHLPHEFEPYVGMNVNKWLDLVTDRRDIKTAIKYGTGDTFLPEWPAGVENWTKAQADAFKESEKERWFQRHRDMHLDTLNRRYGAARLAA